MITPWMQNHLMDGGGRRCTAMSKRSRAQCKRRASIGKTVCAMHGGKSLLGPAAPAFRSGRYSTILPARLLARYHEAERDSDMLALRDEIALVDARTNDILSRVDSGESSKLWGELRATFKGLETARKTGDVAGLSLSLATIGDLIVRGHADWAAWDDVRSLIRDRKGLVESERKRMVESRQMIAVEQAAALMGLLVDAVRRHVTDQETLRAVTDEFARLTGLPSPTGAQAAC